MWKRDIIGPAGRPDVDVQAPVRIRLETEIVSGRHRVAVASEGVQPKGRLQPSPGLKLPCFRLGNKRAANADLAGLAQTGIYGKVDKHWRQAAVCDLCYEVVGDL